MKIFLLDASQDDLFIQQQKEACQGGGDWTQSDEMSQAGGEAEQATERNSKGFMNQRLKRMCQGRSPASGQLTSELSFAVGVVRTSCFTIRAWMTDSNVILLVGMTQCHSAPNSFCFLNDNMGSAHIFRGFGEHTNLQVMIT